MSRASTVECESPPSREMCATRDEILQAMSAHGTYSLITTTTSMRFGAEALLAIVRRRQQEFPGSTQFLIRHSDWFAAHLATAGVAYAAMSDYMSIVGKLVFLP